MLLNALNNDKPTGVFHGGPCMGNIVYHGKNGQKIVLSPIYTDLPNEMKADDIVKLEGNYYPYGSLFG